MASTGFDIDAQGPDLVKFYKAVKSIDVDVQKQLRKRLTATAKPIVEDVKAAALSLPSKHGIAVKGARGQGELGLRAGIAASVQTKINPTSKKGFSIRVKVDSKTFQNKTGKYKKLPRYMEGLTRKPWRHPVFADKGATSGSWKGAWVQQSPKPFMLKAALPYKDKVREEVSLAFLDAMSETHLIK